VKLASRKPSDHPNTRFIERGYNKSYRYCCRRMACGDMSLTGFCQSRLSVMLSTKSTNFGSRYQMSRSSRIDRLSEGERNLA